MYFLLLFYRNWCWLVFVSLCCDVLCAVVVCKKWMPIARFINLVPMCSCYTHDKSLLQLCQFSVSVLASSPELLQFTLGPLEWNSTVQYNECLVQYSASYGHPMQ